MTDEIKEIELDHFNNINELKQTVETWIKEDDMYWNRWFSLYDLKTLLDYITNLQQENKILKAKLEIGKTCGFCPYYHYKSRCQKATNYYLKTLAKNGSMPDEAVEMFNLLEGNK